MYDVFLYIIQTPMESILCALLKHCVILKLFGIVWPFRTKLPIPYTVIDHVNLIGADQPDLPSFAHRESGMITWVDAAAAAEPATNNIAGVLDESTEVAYDVESPGVVNESPGVADEEPISITGLDDEDSRNDTTGVDDDPTTGVDDGSPTPID